jgi:integrase
VSPSRRAPLQHPLAQSFGRAVDSLTAAVAPDSVRIYRGTARNFLAYLGAKHPEIRSLDGLRRDPHILGWVASLRSRNPPLALAFYNNRLIHLRRILEELARAAHLPDLAALLRRKDIPRAPQRIARPLTAQQDQSLQQELLRRNDLGGNVFLLLRHTGMRIIAFTHPARINGRSTVPLGKLKTERMVPVDSFVCALVQRLRFFRSFDPLPADHRLIARPRSKQTLIRTLRAYLHEVSAAAGISARIVPHQLRHYAASRTMPRVDARALIDARLNRVEAA